MWVCRHCSFLDVEFPCCALVPFNEGGFDFLWEMEVPGQSAETMHAIMKIDGDGPDRFHGIIANSKETQHKIDLLNSNWIFLIDIIECNSGHNKYRQHKESNIV